MYSTFPKSVYTLSRRCEATTAPPVDGDENKDEGEDETEAVSTEYVDTTTSPSPLVLI